MAVPGHGCQGSGHVPGRGNWRTAIPLATEGPQARYGRICSRSLAGMSPRAPDPSARRPGTDGRRPATG